MDEQTTEPQVIAPDPVVNTPVVEPQQVGTPQSSAELVSSPEIPQIEVPSEPIGDTPTAQFPPNEPLPDPAPASHPSQPEPVLQSVSLPAQANTVTASPRNHIRDFFAKAAAVIQERKRKKLDKILGLFAKKTHITNDEVEKLLHVSDATATRYLSQLEKLGKIKQSGRVGQGVTYTKI